MSRRTVCFTALILLTHLLAIGVAVGWSAGRPSTGMGHITGLPDALHDAGALALREFDLFSLPSVMRSASWLVGAFGYSICTAVRMFGYIGATMLSACSLLTALLSQAITSLPVQRFTSVLSRMHALTCRRHTARDHPRHMRHGHMGWAPH